MQTHGTYFDGERSLGRPATLTFTPEGILRVEGEGFIQEHPLAQLRVSDRLGDVPRFVYLPGGASIETPDNATLDAALAHRPEGRLSRLIHFLESQQRIAAVACVLLAIAVVTLGYYAPPALARVVAHRVPAPIDKRIGEISLVSIDSFLRPSTLSDQDRARAQRQLDRVLTGTGLEGVRLEFRSMRNDLPNAFALPGNVIIMTDQLVRLPATDDELAAVLAHELGHLQHRHGLQTVLRSSIALVLVAAVTGDLSTLTSFVGTIPATILSAGYSRDLEREADHYALDRLRARAIPPKAFASVMEQLDAAYERKHKGGSKDRRSANWMSTHPESEERIALFGKLTDEDRESFTTARSLLNTDGLYAQAATAAASQNHAQAIKLYTRLITAAPSARAHTLRAGSYRAEGDLDAAEADIATALDIDPDYPEARGMEIEFHRARGRSREALATAQAFHREFPRSSLALAMLGWTEMHEGETRSARTRFDQAIKLDPSNHYAWAFRGYLKTMHDHTDGRTDLDKALELAPHLSWIRMTRGIARNRQGDHVGALQDFQAISEKFLLNGQYYRERGYAYSYTGIYSRALEDYNRALEGTSPPRDEHSYLLQARASAHFGLGDFSSAIADYTHALELTPADYQILQRRAQAHTRLQSHAAALADLDRLLAQKKISAAEALSARRARGYAHWRLDHLDSALSDFDAVVTETRESSDYQMRGVLHLARADHNRAEIDLRASLFVDKRNREYPHFFYLVTCRRAGLPYDMAAFAAKVDAWPKSWARTVGRYLAGEIAEEAFLAEAALGTNPTANERRCEAYFYIGEQHRHVGATALARDYFEKCVATGASTYYEYALAKIELTRLPK